ncbi:MAG: hypothetical protein KDA92_11890 [Planctomycetales bacterium]|nr:hypothetical protein [Planctomycetales bacterium]
MGSGGVRKDTSIVAIVLLGGFFVSMLPGLVIVAWQELQLQIHRRQVLDRIHSCNLQQLRLEAGDLFARLSPENSELDLMPPELPPDSELLRLSPTSVAVSETEVIVRCMGGMHYVELIVRRETSNSEPDSTPSLSKLADRIWLYDGE